MSCPNCGKELVELSPNFCSSCGKRIQEIFVGGTPQPSTPQAIPPCPTPAFSTFLEYQQKKNEERQKYSLGRKGLKHKGKIKVRINVGLMVIQKGGLRPQRGKTISLTTDPDISPTTLLSQAVKKMKDFNKDVKDEPFLLLYPDGTEVINIPGTQRPFTLGAYKAEVGKPYQRITVFICLKRHFEEVGNLSDLSDSDPEIVIKKSSESDVADTLPRKPLGESSPLQQVAETDCHFPLGKNVPTALLPGGHPRHSKKAALPRNILAMGKLALPPNPRKSRETTRPKCPQEVESADGQSAVSTYESVKVDRCGRSLNMDKESSSGTRTPVVFVEKKRADARVPEAAHVNRVPEGTEMKPSTLTDFKRLTVSSKNGGCYLQCPLCYYQCNTKSSFQIHVGSQHPLHCEDMAVGRLGKIIFYQRTAKLFHCHDCFFTSKDYGKLFDHLLVKHCVTRKAVATDKAEGPKPKLDEVKDGHGAGKSGRDLGEVRCGEGRGQIKTPGSETKSGSPVGEGFKPCSPHGALKAEAGVSSAYGEYSDLLGGSLKRKRASASGSEDEDEEEEDEDELAGSQAAKEEKDAAVAKYVAHLSTRYYYCKLCKWRCKKKGFLLYHVSQKHDVPKPHACKECSKTFLLETLLTSHVNLCHKQGLYQCPYCPFESNFLRGIRRHLSHCRVEEDDVAGGDGGPEKE